MGGKSCVNCNNIIEPEQFVEYPEKTYWHDICLKKAIQEWNKREDKRCSTCNKTIGAGPVKVDVRIKMLGEVTLHFHKDCLTTNFDTTNFCFGMPNPPTSVKMKNLSWLSGDKKDSGEE